MNPPRLATRILARALEGDPAGPAILGDLAEDFARMCRERGPRRARRWYVTEALLLSLTRGIGNRLDPPSGHRPLLQDVAYALTTLRRQPGFALFTALVIALGVGATTAVFGIVKPLVLDPLPFRDPSALVRIDNEAEPGETSLSALTSRVRNLIDFRERASSFEGVTGFNAFFEQRPYTLDGEREPERLVGVDVAHDFLDVLGVTPLLGRGFTAEEGGDGGPPAVVLTHGFWVRRFAGDPEVVGRTVRIDGAATPVVGILPPSFDFSSVFTPGVPVDFLRPFPVAPDTPFQGNTLVMVGRLRPGASAASAQAELDALLVALEAAEPGRWGLGARVTPLAEHVAAPVRTGLLLLVAAAGTVLAIVCVNVSNLFLARMPGRAREVAVRRAMGASRTRVVRQLLAEAVAIALAGAALGGLLAWAVTRVVSGGAAIQVPLLDRVGVDPPTLLFGTAVALVTGVVVGIVPALRVSEGSEQEVLRSGGRGGTASRDARRLRETLVVAEVALACFLLVVGGLLLRSFRAVLDVELGFEAADAVAWQLDPSLSFESREERSAFFARVADRVATAPGVEAAGLIDALPLGRNRTWGFSVVGRPEEEDTDDEIFPHVVDPGYRAAMRTPLLAGRDLSVADGGDAEGAVLVNESGARRVFGGADEALGSRIRIWGRQEFEIVGVVADVRHVTPETGPGIQVYFPMAQMPDYRTLDLVVRSARPPEQIAPVVAAALGELDPGMPTREWWTLESRVDRAVSARRFVLGILGGYGAVALFLAGLGIYGVLAQSVAERRAEIGIRMALGASASGVVGDVLRRTVFLAALGIVGGTALSLLGARLVRSLLYQVGAVDPVTMTATAALLLSVALVAGAPPALRASRTRGMAALRTE